MRSAPFFKCAADTGEVEGVIAWCDQFERHVALMAKGCCLAGDGSDESEFVECWWSKFVVDASDIGDGFAKPGFHRVENCCGVGRAFGEGLSDGVERQHCCAERRSEPVVVASVLTVADCALGRMYTRWSSRARRGSPPGGR